MSLRTRAATISAVVMVSAAGCAGTPNDPATPPAQQQPSATAATPATLADPPAGSATVSDVAGDGSTADLRAVSVTLDGSGVVVVYQLASTVPTTGTVLLSLTVESRDGNQARQLGAKWIDGDAQVFVFDFVTSQQSNLAVKPQVRGEAATVVFPTSAVAGLGETFTWHADANVAGNDVDRAPNANGAPFPSK